MPISKDFSDRLAQTLEKIVEHYGTPFHLYDEKGIRETGRELIDAFKNVDLFREYFAVKALPNPAILNIMREIGFGFDCSSIAELALSRQVGGHGEQIMFTSNNTSENEFNAAEADGGCILNLDDISLLDKLPQIPELICFRYNPGERRTGNSIIGNPIEAKYGVAHDQLIDAYRKAKELGVKRFGLHTMLASNELNHAYMVETARMLLDRINWISSELDIQFDFINIGGGLGIPYRPEEKPLDIHSMGREIGELFTVFKNNHGYVPKLYLESGRYITGPHGVLVTTAINRKEIYRTYVGVDSCMSALMRPGMYGAYHHISVLNKEGEDEVVDVVGSLCENNDKFAIQRSLPKIEDGDIICIHDTGAHGQAMGFNYNGKLRPKELLLREDGSVELIRREETFEDLFATLEFKADHLSL
ncbi:MAG: diaminopimelate decarboxylase [Candidatus Thiodiazotropha sp. L084R]